MAEGWRLHIGPSGSYSNAQLDDTAGRARHHLLHRPPVELRLEARTSSPSPGGTLGFGFWNDPFPSWGGAAGAGRLLPASPRALWFFHASKPSQIPFSPEGPRNGWTAAAYRGPAFPDLVVAAMAAGAGAGMLVPRWRARLMRQYWRWFVGFQSSALGDLEAWHAYAIDWREEKVRFTVDDRLVLESSFELRDPLGLVLWIDNQWAALTAEAGLRAGVLQGN